MNYLTNYYKNLSEQLQEKVNHLEQLLEYRERRTFYMRPTDIDPYTNESVPLISGRETTKKGNPLGKGARKEKTFSVFPGQETIRGIGSDSDVEMLAWETVSDDGRPTVENNPIYASMHNQGPPLEVNRGDLVIRDYHIPIKGGSVPGTGKKLRQRNYAQRMAGYRDLNPNVHDSADPDTTASAAEVAASQKRRQLGQ